MKNKGKKLILVMTFLVCALMLSACGAKATIVGTWKRVEPDSPFNNLVVKVEVLDSGFRGVIVELGDGMANYGFTVGDTKWKDIKRIKEGTYEYSDLGRNENGVKWYDCNIDFDATKPDDLNIHTVASLGGTGDKQVWERVTEEK